MGLPLMLTLTPKTTWSVWDIFVYSPHHEKTRALVSTAWAEAEADHLLAAAQKAQAGSSVGGGAERGWSWRRSCFNLVSIHVDPKAASELRSHE